MEASLKRCYLAVSSHDVTTQKTNIGVYEVSLGYTHYKCVGEVAAYVRRLRDLNTPQCQEAERLFL